MKKIFLAFVIFFASSGVTWAQAANPYACAAPLPTMQLGLSNRATCVQAVQWYLDGSNPNPSGNFDAALKTAVQSWQTAHGLTADGIVGPRTWSSFTCVNWNSATGTCADVTPTPPPAGGTSAGCSKLEQNFQIFGGSVPGPLANNCYSPGQAVSKATRLGFTLVAMLAVLFIVIGGYRYMMSRGDEKAASSGRATIQWAAVGLVLVLLAYAITTIVTRLLTTGALF